MTNEIQTFVFEDSQVRAVEIEGEPWFVGKDVAEILGYRLTSKAIQDHVDEEDRKILKFQNGTLENIPNRGLQIINESGLYSLILSSKLPAAKKFKRWVTSEVLPAIRKHGAYMTDAKAKAIITDKSSLADLLQQAADQLKAKDIQIQEMKPKAKFCDVVLQNPALVTVTVIAKDYGMSARAMNKLLKDLGVQYDQRGVWFLYAKYQSKGWTQSATHMVTKKDGTEKAVVNTKWTQKGRLGLYELLKDHGLLPVIEREN